MFADRLKDLRCPSVVLAHVMVHEITHLLQGVSRHSETGVMKAHWTTSDLAAMDWWRTLPFTPQDVALIHAGMAKRTATGALAALASAR